MSTAQTETRGYVRYAKVIETAKEILSQYDHRLTLREIYYRLISHPYQVYTSGSYPYEQIMKHLREARISGEIDWRLIEDPTRPEYGGEGKHKNTREHVEDLFLKIVNASSGYDKAMWLKQPKHVEVWVEKNAVAGTICKITDQFKVMTFATRGEISWTKFFEARARFEAIGKPVVILHLADHGPKGLELTTRIQESFARIYDGDLTIERVLLNFDQVKDWGLTPYFNPTKARDSIAPAYVAQYGDRCWELDAVHPKDLQTLVHNAIVSHIDEDIWNATIEESNKEHKQLEEAMAARLDTFGDLATEILRELGFQDAETVYKEKE